ncbi:hypothetical protein SMD44_p10040 (plasmid) [Streptomyces alboflavus]|uniref:Uncharacterized protein n=1 Tax=Streptomyces alboflavus TaxID=67267 RepID=A0A291W4N1_9ACTN|nr:hypothetical protein [Streptomyces alboflavus]ATM24539.1 hypothetical protein SMD44_p10040 [Streptomyces alboflavus]
MIEAGAGTAQDLAPTWGEPPPQTCLRVAHEATELATAAADHAMDAVCRSRSGNTARLEEVMHAAHREAVEADGCAARAVEWAADPSMPDRALLYCASGAVDHAIRAQVAAGLEATAAALRTELERKLTPKEHAERESARRREEAEQEAAERAVTGMDADNRHLAQMNAYLAESAVPGLGWTAGHVRVLEAAVTGRLYQRDGQTRQAAVRGAWRGGRKVSRERTRDLHAAGFLAAVDMADGTRVLAATPMGSVALELARLHPTGLYESDKAAYEARYARVAKRHKRMDDKKEAARRLPALTYGAVNRYRRPVTLVEQEARAMREATEVWEDEGGSCPGVPAPTTEEGTARCPCCGLRQAAVSGVLAFHQPSCASADGCPGEGLRPGFETPCSAGPRAEEAPAASVPAAAPVQAGPELPLGMYFLPLPSTRYRDWWAIQCGRCQGGGRTELPGEWHDKHDAARAAHDHYDEVHRPADEMLTEQEIGEVERWPLSAAQRTVLHWAEHAELAEFDDGFWALDCVPDRWDVNKKVARGRVTGLWAAGLLDVYLNGNGRRNLVKSPTGRRVARLLLRAERQGVAGPAVKDAKLTPLLKRSGGYPLQSEGGLFKDEQQPVALAAPAELTADPAAAEPTPPSENAVHVDHRPAAKPKPTPASARALARGGAPIRKEAVQAPLWPEPKDARSEAQRLTADLRAAGLVPADRCADAR